MKTSYVVIDIETVPDQTQFDLEASLLKPPATWKDKEKIEQHMAEQREALKDRMALKDSARLSCVGALTEGGIFSFVDYKVDQLVTDAGINCYTLSSEAELLQAFGIWLGMVTTTKTQIVTYNGTKFDLPKLRLGFARSRLPQPEGLSLKHIDLMWQYSMRYSVGQRPFVSLDEVVRRLGIADGKMIKGNYPDMIAAGEHDKAVLYNAFDLLLTERVYRKIM